MGKIVVSGGKELNKRYKVLRHDGTNMFNLVGSRYYDHHGFDTLEEAEDRVAELLDGDNYRGGALIIVLSYDKI